MYKVKTLLFIIILLFVIISLGVLLFDKNNPTIKNHHSIVTPTPFTVHQEPTNTPVETPPLTPLPIQPPPSFKRVTNTSTADKSITFTYTESNKIYHLLVSPPGQINPENGNQSTVTENTVTYGNTTFTQRIWSIQGKPFFAVAIPQSSKIRYIFSMELPPNNADHYLQLFDTILSTYIPSY